MSFWSSTRTARFALAFGLIVPAALSVTMAGTASAATAAPSALHGTFVKIENRTSGQKCMDVPTELGALKVGTPIQLYHCTGSAEQNWLRTPLSARTTSPNGDFTETTQLTNANSALCLAPEGHSRAVGARIVQENCNHAEPFQSWTRNFHRIPGGGINSPAGYDEYVNVGSGLAISFGNGTGVPADHTLLSQRARNGTVGQTWVIG